jgi:hypothetical protein
MKQLTILLFFLPILAYANPPIGTTNSLSSTTGSTALAQTSGNSQGIVFNSQTPGTQTIITTPGLAGMYTPASSECYPSWGAQATGPGAAAGAQSATLSYPCHVKDLSQRIASIAVAANNIGLKDRARKSMENALDYAECAFGDTYLIRKVKGDKCPVSPDWHVGDIFLGGMPRDTVRPTSGYQYIPMVIEEPGQLSKEQPADYITRDEYNKKNDQLMNKAMLK